MRLGLGEICALNISVGRSPRERRQVMCAHLSGSLKARSELDQSRFAESLPKKLIPIGTPNTTPAGT